MKFPLLLHVLGASVLVGCLAAVLVLLVVATRGGDLAAASRLAFRTLLFGALPAYLVMRGAAEWTKSEAGWPDDLAWIEIGYAVTDPGLLLLVAAFVLTGLAARRADRGGEPGALTPAAAAVTSLLVVAYLVALWAMATKPA